MDQALIPISRNQKFPALNNFLRIAVFGQLWLGKSQMSYCDIFKVTVKMMTLSKIPDFNLEEFSKTNEVRNFLKIDYPVRKN